MRTVISVLLLLGLYSCGGRGSEDIVSYVRNPENGLHREVTVGVMHYSFQYKPAEYILKMERLDSAGPERTARKQQLEGMAWFNISFSIKDYGQSPLRYEASSLEEYTSRQDYFLNLAPKDIYMLYGTDTLRVSSYWFENNQNLTAHETMVVGFKLPGAAAQPARDMQLSYYDRVFKNGIIKIIIKQEDVARAAKS